MEGGTSAIFAQDHPKTVREVILDFRGRRAGILKALISEFHQFFFQCDPEKENLCLYGLPNSTWAVHAPQGVLPGPPEPAVGINFPRDSMQREDWLEFIATHSDAWLLYVAHYHCALFDQTERKQVFDMVNDLPTILETIEGKGELHEAMHKKQKTNTIRRIDTKSKSVGSAKNPVIVKVQARPSQEGETLDDHDSTENLCALCGRRYKVDEFWIGCDYCNKWFHGKCVEITPDRADHINQYMCPACRNSKG